MAWLQRMAMTAVSVGLLTIAGCAAPAGHPAVPPVRAEQVPPPPPTRTVVIWQPGHWKWTGADYAWEPGLWIERAGHGTLWQDGYWADGPLRPQWIAAHWL